MAAQILDGKKVADSILGTLKKTIAETKIKPILAIVLCGSDPASLIYTAIKKKRAEEIGITARVYEYAESITEEELCGYIRQLNRQSDAVIVQLPLPAHLNQDRVVNTIDPEKDADGLTAVNIGKIARGDETLAPATPKGIMKILDHYNISLKGKKVTIVNHSPLVGKPLALMLLNRGATVTICHEFTQEIESHTFPADVVVSAVGIPSFIHAEMIKAGAVVVDVGISRKNNSIRGDVDFESVKAKASYLTPVPGGIGPMTVAMLLETVVMIKSKPL